MRRDRFVVRVGAIRSWRRLLGALQPGAIK